MPSEMKVPKGDRTRARIVQAALGLIESRGLTGAGVNQILAAADAPRGSLYFHFPAGKRQLAGEAVSLASRKIGSMIEGTLAANVATGDAIAAVVDEIVGQLERSNFSTGCPVAAVTLDVGLENDELLSQCGDTYTYWQGLLRRRLELDGHALDSAETISAAVLALIEGATVVSRAQRSPTALVAAAATARALIEWHGADRTASR
jgi:TetR/AcrR family transcriptional regulator, lmrAB and yxaGH operons repressor